MEIDEVILQNAKKFINDIEREFACSIILSGFVGSRIIGLHNSKSDYDIRAVALFENEPNKYLFISTTIGNVKMEAKIFSFQKVAADIKKWNDIERKYPTIFMKNSHYLIHNDEVRSQIRLASQSRITYDRDFILKNHSIVCNGMIICDDLDYYYSRAFCNQKNFLARKQVNLRKYLYTVNEILSIKWIIQERTFAPNFVVLLEKIPIPSNITEFIKTFLFLNYNCEEKMEKYVENSNELSEYIIENLRTEKKEIASFSRKNGSLFYNISW